MIKLSVIIAGWRPDGVKKAIENLKKQTYRDFDIILVNDGNPELREFGSKLAAGDDRIHFIDNHTRCHWYGAVSRNMGVMMSFMYVRDKHRDIDNEFIIFCDDDVEFSPNLLAEIADAHENNPEAVMIAPEITEIRGKVNKEYVHRRKTRFSPQNIDLNGLAFHRKTFIDNGLLDATNRHKITYDWELIKKIVKNNGEDKLIFTENNSYLVFHHKRR